MKRSHLIIAIALTAVLCIGAIVLINSQRETEVTPDWQHHYDIGMRFLSQGNYQEAVIAFRAAIEINPRQADAYIGLAEAYIGLGDIDTAIAILRQGYDLTGDARLPERIVELEALNAPTAGTPPPDNSPIADVETAPSIETEEDELPEYLIVLIRQEMRYTIVEEFSTRHSMRIGTITYNDDGFIVRSESVSESLTAFAHAEDSIFSWASTLYFEYSPDYRSFRMFTDYGTDSVPGGGDWMDMNPSDHRGRGISIGDAAVFAMPVWPWSEDRPIRVDLQPFPQDRFDADGNWILGNFIFSTGSGANDAIGAYAIFEYNEAGLNTRITTYNRYGQMIGYVINEWATLILGEDDRYTMR